MITVYCIVKLWYSFLSRSSSIGEIYIISVCGAHILEMYPPESPYVLYGWVPRASNLRKNKNFKYVHQILVGNNTETPIFENHNRMQIITSFAYCMHIIKFWVCSIMH